MLDTFFSNFNVSVVVLISPIAPKCTKSKRCSKSPNHKGKCNAKQSHRFWEKSPIYNLKISQAEVIRQKSEIRSKEVALEEACHQMTLKRQEEEQLLRCVEEQTAKASKYFCCIR